MQSKTFLNNLILLVPVLLLHINICQAQNEYQFKSGLVLNSGARYGREALYNDPLAYRLYTNALLAPKEGDVFGKSDSGAELKWVKVDADTAFRFRSRASANAYLYLSYDAKAAAVAILNISGNASVYVNGVAHMGDPYASGWMNIPIKLNKGRNDFFVRGANCTAKLTFPDKPVFIETADATVPQIRVGAPAQEMKAAIVVVNASSTVLAGLQIMAELDGIVKLSALPVVQAYGCRKVYFDFQTKNAADKGVSKVNVSLMRNGKKLDQKALSIETVAAGDKYSETFISKIDGSLQYYAVAPKTGAQQPGSALFFSVHGAGVEAIGQARAYESKDWGNLVAPTNRRPRGFNWEDWGRLDALEVLDIARKTLNPDPQHIYLTGHSMGGHGTWFLGATYPDKWAAIAPCAGYPTLKGYGSADGLIPDSSSSAMGKILLRASNQSDVPKLAYNYKQVGVYILHGDADRTVSVNYARQMKQQLAGFHADMNYYEYPGGSHWYSNESVDWKPLFDFFKWHKIAPNTEVNSLDFTTASPGISASNRWITVHHQVSPLEYSRVRITRDLKAGTIKGILDNVALLKINLADFGKGATVAITLDSLSTVKFTTSTTADSVYLHKNSNGWSIAKTPGDNEKGPHRYGTFKEGFNKNMLYVYGTGGTPDERKWSREKAVFDAESWYYRGNGAFDIITDKEYSKAKYKDRNVVLVGNAVTNSAWKILLSDCPVQIGAGSVIAGNNKWSGDNLGAYFVWPIAGTVSNTVSVISGSGLKGMQAVTANQYFAGGSGFPDIMVYNLKMLNEGVTEVVYAGFYDNQWKLSPKDLVSK